jgi:hypothetical protein
MMLKNTFHIFISILLLSSCQEININKEVDYTLLLDSLLMHQNELLEEIDSVKINRCLEKTSERIELFELEHLNDFQKQWLHHEKVAYQKIEKTLACFNPKIETLTESLLFSKKQITTLKEDLIHRHLSKDQFNAYLLEEKKALGKLNALSEKLRTNYNTILTDFDSLELKLHGIFTQINALQSEDK